jgi:DNA adenine methylase
MNPKQPSHHADTGTPVAHTDLVPPLKWAGGKRWLLPILRPLWRGHADRRLVEPFVGGMAVSLGLMPGSALLNDVNRHVINFYRWLQRGLLIDIEMKNDKTLYYEHRQRFNGLIREGKDGTQDAAALFYYLNRTGYNGLCRFNKKGKFNVPFGRYKTIHYTRDFRAYAPALSGWQFSCTDFAHLRVHADDLIYADPPYDVEFTSYSAGGFGWEDQVRLAHWLARHPGPVAASNQATDRIVRLYHDLGFDSTLLDGPRRISCNGDRTPAREILAIKGLEWVAAPSRVGRYS